MRVAIIGAGFTGLAAAIKLSGLGHQVTVFEKERLPGGLAGGFKDPKWDWPLEQHYHHLFSSDTTILQLSTSLNQAVDFYHPKSSTYYNNEIFQTDSPASLMSFSPLSYSDRLRTAFGLALLKFNPYWQPFEKFTAKSYITTIMGESSWKILWEPLFAGKFGNYQDQISAAWFWSRIYKRSPSLGYPQGGFLTLAKTLCAKAKFQKVTFKFNHSVSDISLLLKKFDKVICTLPTPAFEKISRLTYPKRPGLGAINLVLALKNQFLTDGTYWLNITDQKIPFLAVVEHTNMVSKDHYAGDHLLYIGNYLPPSHHYFSKSATQLTKIFLPYLKQINPDFKSDWIRKTWIFKSTFAQPIIPINYSQLIPPLKTAIPNLFLANIQQVYPWDRGTNYAVELGYKVADLCTI